MIYQQRPSPPAMRNRFWCRDWKRISADKKQIRVYPLPKNSSFAVKFNHDSLRTPALRHEGAGECTKEEDAAPDFTEPIPAHSPYSIR